MQKTAKILFAASGFIPVLGLLVQPPDMMLLIYTVFTAALLLRGRLAAAAARIRLSPRWKFLLFMVLSGLLAESLAWLSNYLAREPQPALLHPQLIPDLILGVGYYSGWALAWLLALRLWRFSLLEVFLATGLSGIWTEQSGVVLTSLAQDLPGNLPGALLLALYLLAVYGSIAGLAYLPVVAELPQARRAGSLLKYPLAWLMLFGLSWLGTGIVLAGGTFLGLIPEPRPIWEHPLF
jgi:hypothetical protein